MTAGGSRRALIAVAVALEPLELRPPPGEPGGVPTRDANLSPPVVTP